MDRSERTGRPFGILVVGQDYRISLRRIVASAAIDDYELEISAKIRDRIRGMDVVFPLEEEDDDER